MALAGDPNATLGGTSKKSSESVKVVVKVRPLNTTEQNNGNEQIVRMDMKSGVAVLCKPGGSEREMKDFTFDAVFDHTATQQMLFDDTALEIVDSVMDGFNGTIFCYGQTGAGKSFTMTGPENAPAEIQGLLPRSFRHIFANIERTSHQTQYLVRGSYLEIYNEDIRDLLSKTPKERCELKDHPNGGVYVKDLSTQVVKSPDDLHKVLAIGLQNRMTGATNMNAESSRSHSIFLITVEQCQVGAEGDAHIRVGKLNMVDLAGSERQSKTGATGERLKEATKINLSLSALGNVISSLVDGKSSHVPYRDSKLTRLLQDSLGGNTKTVMVANCGPADYNYEETLSTLRYAYRAKSIKNKPRINEDPKDAMIREFQDEILRLKQELMKSGSGEGEGDEEAIGEFDEKGYSTAPRRKAEKLAPIIQKETVVREVEKEVEVKKEIIIEVGPSPEEVAAMQSKMRLQNDELKRDAERKRAEVERMRDVAEAEKTKYLADIEREESAALKEQQRKNDLQQKLGAMEQKMVVGKQVMEKAIEQEEELKRRERELRKQKKIESKLKEKEEQQRAENVELETKCASQEEQVQKLTAKLQKLWDKYQKAQQEMVDIQEFNQGEREDMLSMIRELRQTLKLKTLIMESFVPKKEQESVLERGEWDAEEDEWVLRPVVIDKSTRPLRPPSCFGLPRPTAEFTRLQHAMGDPNPRYMYDSIVMTDLDLPERTTEDYETHPDLGERVEKSLLLALSPEEEETSSRDRRDDGAAGADDRRRSGSGRPTSSSRQRRPGSKGAGAMRDRGPPQDPMNAFPQARGLVSQE
jgi:kinesin family protein 3/17